MMSKSRIGNCGSFPGIFEGKKYWTFGPPILYVDIIAPFGWAFRACRGNFARDFLIASDFFSQVKANERIAVAARPLSSFF